MDNTDYLDLTKIRILMKVSKKKLYFGLDTTDFTEKADKLYNNNKNKIIIIIIIIIIKIIK